MNDIYYILIPLIASVIGGLISGLFTFLGVRATLTHQKEVHEEDLNLREEEINKQNTEIRIEKNKQVNQTRPELSLINNVDNFNGTVKEIYLLPFTHTRLSDNKTVEFEYDNEVLQDGYWEQHEIVLQNIGKRKIQSIFLQVPYTYNINLHFKDEIITWESSEINFYHTNEKLLFFDLNPNDNIKLILYYPKDYVENNAIPLDAYIHDEDENYWYQSAINLNMHTESTVYEKAAFNSRLQGKNNYLYISKTSDNLTEEEQAFLEQQSEEVKNIDKLREQFVKDVNEGKTLLNYRLPIR